MAPEDKWYFSGEEIKKHSPSRKDGISFKDESHLRQLYCSYIKEIGMELEMPQKTIASAMVLCHRFYMRQSHAKNSWQTMASACLFLAAKSEDTPRFLRDIVCLAYKLQHQWDPLARQRIKRDKEVYDKQKETVLLGERLLLFTLGFELDVKLPYAALVAAVKNLGISHSDVVRVSWNYVNDWLWTTLCLRYEPRYIAAGSLYLAAKRVKLELPSSGADAWWMQFEVSPKQLDGVLQHMLRFEERAQKRVADFMSSPESCASVAEGEDDGLKITRQSEEKNSGLKRAGVDDNNHINIDIYGIREKLKKRKLENKPSALETLEIRDDGLDEAWIERELESGVEK